VDKRDEDAGWDPSTFVSEKTGRGPLTPNWQENTAGDTPFITIYKATKKPSTKLGTQALLANWFESPV
jgi:hypothetical protein